MRKLSSLVVLVVQSLSHVQHLVTPWTVARQAPLPLGFPGKNTGVGCHFLFQGIFLTQGLNLGLLHCRQNLYYLSHGESHTIDGMNALLERIISLWSYNIEVEYLNWSPKDTPL